MKIGITGTPGTGKTTVSKHLETKVISLKEFAKKRGLGVQKQEFEVDVQSLQSELPESYWIEGHLAHYLDLDFCVVLRTRPDVLEDRLSERSYSEQKIRENVEAEKMDLILSEASARHVTYEVDTTDREPEEVASEVEKAVEEREERTGVVDWSEFI